LNRLSRQFSACGALLFAQQPARRLQMLFDNGYLLLRLNELGAFFFFGGTPQLQQRLEPEREWLRVLHREL